MPYDIIRGIAYPGPADGEVGHRAGELAVDLAPAGAEAIAEWLSIGAVVESTAAAKPKRGRGVTSLVVEPQPADGPRKE